MIQTIISAVLLLLFIVTAALTLNGNLFSVENNVFDLIFKTRSSAVTVIMKTISIMTEWYAFLALAFLFLLIPYIRKKFGFPLVITISVSAVLNLALKHIFARARPDVPTLAEASGYSFPSGHTQTSAAFFAAIILILLINYKSYKRIVPLIIICGILPFLIGFSRIYLGAHYLGDVIGGLTFGSFLAFAVSIFWSILNDKIKNPKVRKILFTELKQPDDISLNHSEV